MHFRFTLFFLMALSLAYSACDGQKSTDSDRVVEFKNRKIDLQPYVEGFPYYGFTPFFHANKLYYFHQDSTTKLKAVDLGSNTDLKTGELVSDIDFSKRNVWGIRYRENDEKLYWTGDEKNDEIINLYQLDPNTRAIKKLTEVPYIFGWRWNEAKDKVAYIARLGDKEKRLGELRVLDLESMEEKNILQDTPEYRLTWDSPSWQPQGKGVVLSVLKNADRTYGNLAYVDFKTQKLSVITDPRKARSWPTAYREWLNDNEFMYFSNENGFENIFSYNLKTRKTRQLTNFDIDLNAAELVSIDGEKYIFAVLSNPIENEILLINPQNGDILQREKVNFNVGILDTKDNKMLVSINSATIRFRIDALAVDKSGFHFTTRIDMPEDLKTKLLHARQERIDYPTFDIDPKTGETRKLHAFLYHPEKPLPKSQQIVMIQSFYGGGNSFSTQTQILADAGIYVLSPSPRGSNGFGREFESLNDKDLGGNEIIDVIYAAKYISEKLDIPPNRIGVYGGSHGGYATMRCLTFPGEINGNKASFEWGFGISHAGFSDINHFYENCNIPDWVILEAGDPKTEADKLRDRSPLYHADKMVGKLLLTHGTNDNRVPIEGSRWMADSLRVYNKDVTLIEFEGQGHGIKGLENTVRFYNVWFDFLDKI
ncbi:MAG: S9 family peptidase [Deferribacteres bacterium]|nr:S9 family peptidase [candidate division KSB1 bacterium]MCB9504487.1 S9 family peptidase [Deferribacteres bacterium]